MSLNKSKALRTAEKYVLQGKVPAAIDEYRKVVDADPTDLTTINTLGDLYVRAGKIQDAITNFSRIAESYRESGFTLKAIAMLKKISKLDPTNVETSMKLANLYSQQGLLVEARQQYLQVADAYARAGQTRKALEAYQKIADLDPSNTSVRMKLGEIYSREGMTEQSHEAFIMAGAEFLRKGDTEQALNANLKAILINPESRQGLTAIATIYTQQGQADRAINILCEAFEKNPGDVELLTILGRTYLSAGLMDDAERTFLSLVELDRNRYHYLLEVGRRFLQLGDLDRAAEQIDGCLDVLIAKREEDKAIDFLRKVLDRDMNHIGALKRMAQIFLRIREDHNLIASLNSLAEAAMRKGDDEEAISALTELTRLEPDEPMHRQRLYNLGVRDIVEPGSPDVVMATGPLDYESAAFDDTFVIRQISEAEILAGHGQVEHAVAILQEILNHTPENVQVHQKLKDIYLRAGMTDKAAAECLDLARIHEGRGESARANDYLAEAHQLDPLLEQTAGGAVAEADGDWAGDVVPASALDGGFGAFAKNDSGFEVLDSESGFDLSQYQTGPLTDQMGFVTIPPEHAPTNGHSDSPDSAGQAFRYTDTLSGDNGEGRRPHASAANQVFSSAGNIPSDTMTSVLRDELEGIDFYIAQGYIEIARDTLDRLRDEHGDHPEIKARYNRLGVSFDPSEDKPVAVGDAAQEPASHDPSGPKMGTVFLSDLPDFEVVGGNGGGALQQGLVMADEKVPAENWGEAAAPPAPAVERAADNVLPFLINKESGPLSPDLLVHFNTSDLLNDTAFDPSRLPSGMLRLPVQDAVGTGDLFESIVSEIDSSFDSIQEHNQSAIAAAEPEAVVVAEPVTSTQAETDGGAASPAVELKAAASENIDFNEVFEELKENTGGLKPLQDFETHYNLGLAYKDMDLYDEAVEQFQMAFKMAEGDDIEGKYMQCCHMLGVCFNRKQIPKVAVMWFQRGLKVPNRTDNEYQALRYEIGSCYETMGEADKALDAFMEVYGVDVNYREVGEKIKHLQALKSA